MLFLCYGRIIDCLDGFPQHLVELVIRLGVHKPLRQRSGETGNHKVILRKLLIGFLTAVPAGKRDHTDYMGV